MPYFSLIIHLIYQPRLFHRCTEETTVRGYTIPKDTHVIPHLDSVLRSEKIWGDPLNFRPERFIDNKGNLLNPEEFIPFLIGTVSLLLITLKQFQFVCFFSTNSKKYFQDAISFV